MEIPISLTVGDKVSIVTTARKISDKEIVHATDLLKQWGLVPVLGNTINLEDDQFGGSDVDRAYDFQEQLDNPEIKAIWCARGGYGTIRIIDLLDFSAFRKQPKWIIGYSDVTILHSHLQVLGVATLHAAMPIDIHNTSSKAKTSLRDLLFGQTISYKIKSSKKNRLGVAQGILVGGNLSILYSLCGSPSALETKGKILFIEDLDEYLYHVDRMLQNLKRNGMLTHLKALIVGGMTKMHDNSIPFGKKVNEIILDTVKEYSYPVVFNFPAGHMKDNRALVFGTKVSLTVSEKKVKLTYN